MSQACLRKVSRGYVQFKMSSKLGEIPPSCDGDRWKTKSLLAKPVLGLEQLFKKTL